MGRHFDGAEDDAHGYPDHGTDDEKNGLPPDRLLRRVSNGSDFNQDELYTNERDIQEWERKASAFNRHGFDHENGYHDDDDGYYDETGESITHAEYEEMLFRRVLDKIRAARVTGDADVQLSSDELEAYQSKVNSPTTPAPRPDPQSRRSSASITSDTASVITTSRPGHIKGKKSQQRTSFFGTKPKKDKSSHRKRSSPSSSVSSQVSPGLTAPRLNTYEGNSTRDPSTLSSGLALNSPREIVGAFPGSEHTYPSAILSRQGRSNPSPVLERPPHHRAQSTPMPPPGWAPYHVQPYHYHAFSPPSSAPTSPQDLTLQRYHSGPYDYLSMARRPGYPPPNLAPVPVPHLASVPTPVHAPTPASAPVSAPVPAIAPVPSPISIPAQRAVPGHSPQGSQFGPAFTNQVFASGTASLAQDATPGAAKVGERRRKGGRAKKG